MHLEPLQWAIAALVAFLIGLSKTGINGIGLLSAVLMALVIPSTRQVSGLVLPFLILGDAIAVLVFRRHAQWPSLWRLFPWTAAGVLAGWWAMGRMNDRVAAHVIGGIVCVLVAVQLWRQYRMKDEDTEGVPYFAAATLGVLAGFTTLVANAAGPLMAIYLLAMRLPKLQFVGTGAVFFMILNWFKVPFSVNLGLITWDTLLFNLKLAPAVIAGAAAGPWVLKRISQRLFEQLALVLSFLTGLKLLFF
ncbi:sulfite exporter TauE/SafE family protein [Nibricoccus sp. IMCC34717]|uniref:sulfite exporter TauE/SafE family protein n=1 Tax=Nibricoccus sp. IMCC34717 TaxID=3034021 RepID=UPI0038507507